MEGTERAAARIDDLLKSSCCSDSTRMEGTESGAAIQWHRVRRRCSDSTRMEGTESTKSHRLCTRSAWLQRLDPHGGY